MGKDVQRSEAVELPESLLTEIDGFANGFSRSEFITLAVKNYMREKRRIETKKQMKQGYLSMGKINLDIAENSLLSDEGAINVYEDFLSESDKSDSKTR